MTTAAAADELGEAVSPELALVDPTLRLRLIALEAGRASSTTAVKAPHPASVEPIVGGQPIAPAFRYRRSVVFLAAAAGAAGMLAALEGPRSFEGVFEGHSRTAASAPVAAHRAPVAAHRAPVAAHRAPVAAHRAPVAAHRAPPDHPVAAKTARPATVVAPAPATFRLAWAPATDASSYEVALYQHNERVFQRVTTKPELVLVVGSSPAEAVAPGRYRWYVWPIRHGRRETVAVVRSQLLIP